MADILAMLLAIIGTAGVYGGARLFYQWKPFPFTLPILTGTVIIVLCLIITGMSYDTYMIGGQWIEHLLGPAVVALAYPLYKQRQMLKRYFFPVVGGVTVGAFVGVYSGYFLARLLNMDDFITASLLPKSVTTPVAMELATTIGGAPSLAAMFVMVAGIGGVVSAPYVYKWCKIDHSLAKGIGMGSASHAIGTSKALENGETEGASSSVAMTLSAMVVSILIPLSFQMFF